MPAIKGAIACLAILSFYAFFYRWVVRHAGMVAQALVRRSGIDHHHSVREVQDTAKLAAAGVAQGLFAAGLVTALGVGPALVPDRAAGADLLILGGILGIGELGLASLLCTVAVRLLLLGTGDHEGAGLSQWLIQTRGGWVSQFRATVRTAPLWFAMASIGLYVSVEELVFRGIVIEVFRDAGSAWAVGISLVLFVVVQAFNMPSARAALFPMIGAAVVGLVHGILYWQVRDLGPLILAHLTFFGGAMVLLTRDGGSAEAR